MIDFGTKVKDRVTGFRGVVTARCEYDTSCVQYGVQAVGLNDGKPIALQWIDEGRLVKTGKAGVKGGPMPTPPARRP